MTKKSKNQKGFIPLIIMLLLILAVFVFIVYTRVHNAQG
jgi:hypothetical protein